MHSPIRGTLLLVALLAAPAWGQQPSFDGLLPPETVLFVTAENGEALEAAWNRTQLGKLLDDPLMDPFVKDLRKQFKEKGQLTARLGLTVQNLKDIVAGELSLGYVHLPKTRPCRVLLVDITGKQEEAVQILTQAQQDYLQKGYTSKNFQRGNTTLTVIDPPRQRTREQTRTVYFIEKNILVATESWDVSVAVLERITGSKESLKGLKAYQAIMERCGADAKEAKPELRCYLNPFGLLDAIIVDDPDLLEEADRTNVELLKGEGFTAVQALGGYGHLGTDPHDFVGRGFIYAPGPFEKSMQMLKFPRGGMLAPLAWAPANAAWYITANVDALNVYDHFGTFFNNFWGEGEKGLFQDLMKSLEEEKTGPMISVRDELIAHFANRFEQVIIYPGANREWAVTVIECKKPDAVAATLEKLFRDEPWVRKIKINGNTAFELYEDDIVDEQGKPLPIKNPPDSLITVSGKFFYMATHKDFLIELTKQQAAADQLSADKTFQLVGKHLAELGAKDLSGRGFLRGGPAYQHYWNLARQNKLKKSDSLVGRAIDALFAEPMQGDKEQQRFDGSKLPEFAKIKQYFTPGGAFVVREENGWFVKGAILKQQP